MPRRPRTTPRKKPRQERSLATVDAILDATARVLCTTGYDRASTNRIALAAGVSVGSLYQYFPSKEALVAALAGRHMATMTALVRAKLSEVSKEPMPVAVRTIIMAMFEAHAVDPKLHKVLIEEVPRIGRLENLRGLEREDGGARVRPARGQEARAAEDATSRRWRSSWSRSSRRRPTRRSSPSSSPRRSQAVADELTDLVLRYLVA